MRCFWIGLAMVLWTSAYAVAADAPPQVPQWFPPAMTTPANKAPSRDAAPPPRSYARPEGQTEVPTRSFVPANRESWRTKVWHLRNMPATQLAQTLNTLVGAQQRAGHPGALAGAVIVPETIGNSLVVAGTPEALDEVGKLIASLDRAPAMVRVEVVIGDVATADLPAAEAGAKTDADKVRASVVGVEEAQKKMDVLFRAQLTTLDNQPASLQSGRCEPTIASVNISSANPTMGYGYGSPGNPSNSRSKPPAPEMTRNNGVQMQHLGTALSFTPRVNAERVVAMQLDLSDSRFAPANEGVPIFEPANGDPIRARVIENLMVETTIKVADGQTLLLSDMSRQVKNGKQRVVLLTVHVIPVGDPPKH